MEPTRKSTGERARKGRVALVVEDEPSAREATARYLESRGHDVWTAANGQEALEQAARLEPEVLVCDWCLGSRPDGVEVARQLTERYGVAVIFTTAHPIDELRGETEDLPVLRYFRKPVSLPELADAVADQGS